MKMEGQVGPQIAADGTFEHLRLDKSGAAVVQQLHGKYYEVAKRGSLFVASNVAAQAVSVALATTYTGLCLSNPLGNDKDLVLLGCQYALSVAPAAIASLHLIAGFNAAADPTHTTPLAAPGARNCRIGTGAPPTAKVDSAATVANPTYLMGLGSGFTAAALYATTPSWIDLAGAIILPPGAWVAWGALTAVTGFGSFMWEEVPSA